jgi:uncharacterized protein
VATAADGLPDFAPRFDTSLVKPFYEALARGEFRLPACSICGTWQWYPYEFIKCHAGATHEWREAPKTGRVFTFAAAHRGFLPNASPKAAPYVSALVELDGIEGVRIPTYLVNLQDRAPAIGMRVRLLPQHRTGYVAAAFEPA